MNKTTLQNNLCISDTSTAAQHPKSKPRRPTTWSCPKPWPRPWPRSSNRRTCAYPRTTSSTWSWMFRYSWFHELGSFGVQSFSEHYLAIPECTGSWGNYFQEIHGTLYSILKLANPERELDFDNTILSKKG